MKLVVACLCVDFSACVCVCGVCVWCAKSVCVRVCAPQRTTWDRAFITMDTYWRQPNLSTTAHTACLCIYVCVCVSVCVCVCVRVCLILSLGTFCLALLIFIANLPALMALFQRP